MADFEHGIRNGDGVVLSTRNNIARLCGKYVRGKLQGKGKLVRNYMKIGRRSIHTLGGHVHLMSAVGGGYPKSRCKGGCVNLAL